MSNEKQETITDIVDDIRAQNQGLPEDSKECPKYKNTKDKGATNG